MLHDAAQTADTSSTCDTLYTDCRISRRALAAGKVEGAASLGFRRFRGGFLWVAASLLRTDVASSLLLLGPSLAVLTDVRTGGSLMHVLRSKKTVDTQLG